MQVVLRVIKLENIANPLGFLSVPMSESDVNKVISVLNKTTHINLNQIDQTWQTDLPALVLVNMSVNQPVIAKQIKDIVDEMNSGIFDGLVKFTFVFAPGFSHAKAFGLSMIVYGVFLRFFCRTIVNLVVRRPWVESKFTKHHGRFIRKPKLHSRPNQQQLGLHQPWGHL